jgi:hypothetical protein
VLLVIAVYPQFVVARHIHVFFSHAKLHKHPGAMWIYHSCFLVILILKITMPYLSGSVNLFFLLPFMADSSTKSALSVLLFSVVLRQGPERPAIGIYPDLSVFFPNSLVWRDNPHFSEEVCYQYTGQKNCAGYSDERKKEIARFFWPWVVEGPDGKDIDKEAEAQPEKEADGFDHELDITQSPAFCQPSCS